MDTPHTAATTAAPGAGSRPNSDRLIAALGSEALRQTELLNRVGRVLQELTGRAVADDEILQHASDCTRLMEQAYARFEAFGDPADREASVLWMHRDAEARRCLSREWKTAREALVQRDIAQGTGCYFLDQADLTRAFLARGRG